MSEFRNRRAVDIHMRRGVKIHHTIRSQHDSSRMNSDWQPDDPYRYHKLSKIPPAVQDGLAIPGYRINGLYRHRLFHNIRCIVIFGNRYKRDLDQRHTVSIQDMIGIVIDFDILIAIILFSRRLQRSGKLDFSSIMKSFLSSNK